MKQRKKIACEWCSIELDDNNLYSLYGYKEYIGPICKTCQKQYSCLTTIVLSKDEIADLERGYPIIINDEFSLIMGETYD